MNIKDFIIPENLNDSWIIIHTNITDELSSIQVDRMKTDSSFSKIDVMVLKKFSKRSEVMSELQKQRGDWSACVSTGGQDRGRPSFKFLQRV